MWTRKMVMVACCLVLSSSFAAGGYPDAEVVPAPAGTYAGSPAAIAPCATSCATPVGQPTEPWYYWWTTWHWFDRCTDRGQHYAYMPPLPGWYYFRPYSVGQLRSQQEAVIGWGGDPRNPYATGTLPQQQIPQPQPVPSAAPSTAPSSAPASAAPGSTAIVFPVRKTTAPTIKTTASAKLVTATDVDGVATPAEQPANVIPWPSALQDSRFATQRARIEAPYLRNLAGSAGPTNADYRDMIDAAEQMKVILWQITSDVSAQDSIVAEKFLDQLVIEARSQVGTAAAPVVGQNKLVFGP